MGHHYQRTGNYVQRGGAVPVLLNSIHKEPIQQGGALAVLRVANQVGGITTDGGLVELNGATNVVLGGDIIISTVGGSTPAGAGIDFAVSA